MGGDKMAKRSSLGNLMRKRLSDITNLQSQPKPPTQHENPQHVSPVAEDYINQLLAEKMTLMELIEERNKIIELSGTELQNLRICLQKLQLQNWNLAQSNTQMLAELNLGKDRVKAMQHELVCKDAFLKAKNQENKGKVDSSCQKNSHVGQQGAEECMATANDDDKHRARNRRRNARSQSMGPSTTSQRSGGDKEKIENKRRCLRRQTARLKSQEQGILFELDDIGFAPIVSSERCSIGRPLRKAAEKVQSYKECPLNVKMRRTD
ncbi:hypothetical protein F3Y22_tig00013680pilonHSYRG00111 [Hibiscus syriacus]|uniref:Shugoshin C-terminal domain-containing protein n=1 Tax=Hibiscus syriacus TaxID=106335 RepID=A0A6A3C129_HIBSY|nr:SHUGOSHIN 2-like [Hibiscus syriacus]KAE8722780.1 hypothetical protein F3Y22_tig00013680pilonHSYRG00111 [Hibiscus syriacus]